MHWSQTFHNCEFYKQLQKRKILSFLCFNLIIHTHPPLCHMQSEMNHSYNSSCFKSFFCLLFFFTRNNISICAHWWARCIFHLSPVILLSKTQLIPPIHPDIHNILCFCVFGISFSSMIFASLQCAWLTTLQSLPSFQLQLQLCIACWIEVAWVCFLSLMANTASQYRSREPLMLSKQAGSKACFLSCTLNTNCLHRKAGDNPWVIYRYRIS